MYTVVGGPFCGGGQLALFPKMKEVTVVPRGLPTGKALLLASAVKVTVDWTRIVVCEGQLEIACVLYDSPPPVSADEPDDVGTLAPAALALAESMTKLLHALSVAGPRLVDPRLLTMYVTPSEV